MLAIGLVAPGGLIGLARDGWRKLRGDGPAKAEPPPVAAQAEVKTPA